MRLLLAAAFAFLSSVQVFAQATSPVRSIMPRQPVAPTKPPLIPLPIHTALSTQGVEGGFWHTDGNYDPILRIKNILLKQPLDVTPSIFLADGTEYRLPVVHLEAAGITQINVRYALQDAPANIRAHMSEYGMVGATYRWAWAAVIVSVENQDEIASLDDGGPAQADITRVHAEASTDRTPQVIRGTWWMPTANADQYISLHNPSLALKTLTVEVGDSSGLKLASKTISLPSHATTVYRLSELLGSKPNFQGNGEITVRYEGVARGLLASSGIEDGAVGYSSSPHFVEQHQDRSKPMHLVTVQAPGLMIGKQDPAMQFAEGTVFSPYAMLHNISEHPLTADVSLTWEGRTGEPQTRTLAQVPLAPGASQKIEVPSYFTRSAPMPDGYAHLSITYQGREGDLITDAGSVDQTGNYVFEVATSIAAPTLGKILCFWELQGTRNTMFTVWNYTAEAQEYELKLLYSGGEYRIPIHLAAGKAYNMDLMTLMASKVADPDGTLIPSNITSGSAMLTGKNGEGDTMSVAATSATFSPDIQDCHVNCYDCTTTAAVSFVNNWPNVPIGSSVQYTPQETLSTGTTSTPAGTWSMSNSNATVNSSGLVTGVTPGTSKVSFVTEVPYDVTACGNESCPWEQVTVPQPVTVSPTLSITNLTYTNSLSVWQDGPSNPTPVAMSQTVWTSSLNYSSVFEAGSSISATATFSVNPVSSTALTGASITGNVTGLGQLTATGITIPAGAGSVTVTLSGNSPFPPSTTQYYSGLSISWFYSQTGQTCSSSGSSESSNCQPAGTTSSPVYVTLASPSGLSESVMPLTAVKLAIGSGGATTQAAAFQNTWSQFAGPANVTGWDGRSLYYYEQGVPFSACATSSVGLLTQSNGSGQCGSWARLLMDALAVNGITSSFIQIQPTDKSSMLINNWTFNNTSNLYPAPYDWNLTLPVETDGPGMVPTSSVSGGISSGAGLPGQNSATPSEKFFGLHFIVEAPSSLGAGYYDPSYGVTYSGPCSFESAAVAGYALPASTNSPTASTWNYGVRKPTGSCNITFTSLFTN